MILDQRLEDRLKAVERLTLLFRWERVIYIAATSIALLLLLLSSARLILAGEAGVAEISMLFGSSGAIAYSTGRLEQGPGAAPGPLGGRAGRRRVPDVV